MKRFICFYETYILVLQLVMLISGSVNRFVEMLFFFQYFNIFSIKCLVFFFFQVSES